MQIEAISVVYANLVLQGLKEVSKIPANRKEPVMVVVCSKKIISGEITFKAACGENPDALDPKYKNNEYTGFCMDNEERKQAVSDYVTELGYESLIRPIVI